SSVKKLFVDFAQWSTVVCLNNIATKTRWLALVYAIVFVVMLFLFVFISVNLILKYVKHPSSTELSLDVRSEKFPRFSFCNENPLKRSVVDTEPAYAEIAKLMGQFDQITQQTSITDDFGIGAAHSSRQRFTRGRTMLRLLMHKLSDADRRRGGYSFTELVNECTFAGKTCASADFTSFLHPDLGVCYTFASNRDSTRVDTEQGLKMLLTVNQDSPQINVFDFLPTTTSATIRAVIHQPEEFPDFMTNGFKMGSSKQASLSLSSVRQANSPVSLIILQIGHNRTGKPYRNCIYQYATCQASCLQRLAWETCGCVDPLYLKADAHVYCPSPVDMMCLVSLVSRSNSSCDHCLSPCSERRLAMTVTYGVYPSAKYQVAAGSQAQRAVLMDEQGGGRQGEQDNYESNDYE
ncbi:hypothetical protein PENTCL1PPCAC_14335, partial [Pristionchus entomophagus]